MPKKVTYRYRVPFATSWRSYLVPIGPLAVLVLLTALFWGTHHALLTASTVDAVRPGSVPGELRPVLWVDEGLRYRVHVVAAAEDPGTCTLAGQKATYPVNLDRARHDGDAAEIKGYRWVGAFRAPATDYVAVTCERSSEALRVKVDAPGAGLLVALFVLWPREKPAIHRFPGSGHLPGPHRVSRPRRGQARRGPAAGRPAPNRWSRA